MIPKGLWNEFGVKQKNELIQVLTQEKLNKCLRIKIMKTNKRVINKTNFEFGWFETVKNQ
jgi:hypothetical protein